MTATAPTHEVEVPEIGTFTFLKRTPSLSMRIVSTSIDFIGEPARTAWQAETGTVFGTLKVLLQRAPEGFDLDALDPLEPADYAKALAVWGALREKEARFRGGA